MSNDPINPNHYKFTNGAEVIDITERLTYNGGNAVKYLARSTRMDGAVKGNVLEDLKKAQWYVNREIERVEPKKAKPRVWEEYTNVPINTQVISRDGLDLTRSGFFDDYYTHCGPFTEVI